MIKTRYSVDPHNRLVVEERGKKTKLTGFRKALNGRFKTGKNNVLIYNVKIPADHGIDIPHQFRFKGNWSLVGNNNLKFTLDEFRGRRVKSLTLKGEIIDVRKDALLVSITTRKDTNAQSTYILKLRGAWQADKHNRLIFAVEKGRGRHDTLALNSIWELDKHHQIIYRYEKARLIRKSRKRRTLTFKGYWDVGDNERLSYVIDRNSDSVFSFKTSYGKFRKNYVKYKLGIGLSRKSRPVKRVITLFGKWRIKRNIGLVFEVKYKGRKRHSLVFGAEATLKDKNTVVFRFKKTVKNKDFGLSLKVSRIIAKKDKEIFVRLLKSGEEKAVFIGGGMKW